MNPTTKRIVFWGIFIIVIVLIVWGLVAANNKSTTLAANGGVTPIAISHSISSSTDWTEGSSTAPVQLVEYADFQCPACAAYSPVLHQLIASSSGEIYFAYRYFPLPQHVNALSSAYAATAAGLQGKFWEMHDILFANQTTWQDVADPTSIFLGYAQQIGLDTTKFTADAKSDAVKARVAAGLQDATTMGLDYTPTLFVNGKRIANPSSYAALKQIIDDAANTHA